MPGAGFGGDALQSLLFGVVGLRDGRVELVAARGVVALELIIDFGRSVQRLFEEISPHQRRWTIHLVEVYYFFRYVEPLGVVIEFLLIEFGAEDRRQIVVSERFAGSRVDERSRFVGHVGAHVVPLCRNLVFG